MVVRGGQPRVPDIRREKDGLVAERLVWKRKIPPFAGIVSWEKETAAKKKCFQWMVDRKILVDTVLSDYQRRPTHHTESSSESESNDGGFI